LITSFQIRVTDEPTDHLKQQPFPERGGLHIMLRKIGAGDEIRTHDPNLGKVVLYP
jgi:hypothetical protein